MVHWAIICLFVNPWTILATNSFHPLGGRILYICMAYESQAFIQYINTLTSILYTYIMESYGELVYNVSICESM